MKLDTLDITWQRAFIEGQKYVEPIYGSPKDHATALIYAGVMQDRKLVSLTNVIAKGGFKLISSYPVPNLAVAHAEARYVRVDRDGGKLRYGSYATEAKARAGTMSLPHIYANTAITGYVNATTEVPPVPPAYRPKEGLKGYAILWEAAWKPIPPVDPVLLRHYVGDVWEVIATWDLTEAERMALTE